MNAQASWVTVLSVTGVLVGAALGLAAQQNPPAEKLFLMKAAQAQKGEIALGKLAAERAASQEVKEFGQLMIEDHSKANQEVRQLASQQGVELPQEMAAMQKEKAQRFSQLTGKEFDRAYMKYMLRDHVKDVTEFEHSTKEIKDPEVQQWATKTLPILKQHLQTAKSIASTLGIEAKELQ